MIVNSKDNVVYLTFPEIEKLNFVKHAFSTKLGGVSKNQFSSMNLGFSRGDLKENVIENYCRLCRALEISIDDMVASSQDHGTFIRCVTEEQKGIGIFREHDIKSVDGLLTNVPGVVLVTYYADCTPLYFVDPVDGVVGLAHAGWRGTVGRIGFKMIEKMKQSYGCSPENIVCAIGPAIGKCCFEVDEPVAEKFFAMDEIDHKSLINQTYENKYLIDLAGVNKHILMNSGIPEKNICLSNVCTKCHGDILFSHRQTKGKRGTMIAILGIKKESINDEK